MKTLKIALIEQFNMMSIAMGSSIYRIFMIILAFLMPINGILLTVLICIFADTALGIWKANKLNEPITSRKMSQLISKMFLYESTIILFFLIDKFILNDIIQTFFTVPLMLTKLVALTLMSIELFSMDENWRAVKGSGLFDAFKKLVSRAKDVKDNIDVLK